MHRLQMSLLASALLALLFPRAADAGQSSPPPGGQYTTDDNPVLRMFRNFASSFPPYANPMNYIPPQAFPPGGAYPGQFGYGGAPGGYGGGAGGYGGAPGGGSYGYGYGGPYNGMGYSGPFTPSGYGQPNPGYGSTAGGAGGSVPVLDTRLAGGQGGGQGTSVVKTDDGRYATVSVQSNPDGKPVFRSQTVTGPDSYGTAFAYSSG